MNTTMAKQMCLPKAFLIADLVPFEPRHYDYWEDDEGYEQRELDNYDTYTRKADICRMAIERNKPVYYFRRHESSALEDKNYINHNYKDRFGIVARMYRRRVLVMSKKIAKELYDYKKEKIDLALKKEYNTNLDSMSWTFEDVEVVQERLATLPSIFRERN